MIKNNFLKLLSVLIFFIVSFYTPDKAKAQEFGVSFSYFLPRDGYFSTPISPFSFRGVGINLNRFVAIETGFTLYRMSGLNIKDVPFDSEKPIMGPNFTILTPLELIFELVGARQEFRIKGGGFLYLGFDNKIQEGNLDRALREYKGWEVLNSNYDFDNKLGKGFHFGAEYIFYLTEQFGISLGANYFIGDSKLNLTGSYTGGTTTGTIQTVQEDFPDSKIDFTGLEVSIGVLMATQ